MSDYMLQMKRKFIPGLANMDSHLPPSYLCRHLLDPGPASFFICETSESKTVIFKLLSSVSAAQNPAKQSNIKLQF